MNEFLLIYMRPETCGAEGPEGRDLSTDHGHMKNARRSSAASLCCRPRRRKPRPNIVSATKLTAAPHPRRRTSTTPLHIMATRPADALRQDNIYIDSPKTPAGQQYTPAGKNGPPPQKTAAQHPRRPSRRESRLFCKNRQIIISYLLSII